MSKPPIELPDRPPSGAMVVRWRLGLFVDDRLVGHAGLTAHWAPVWNHVPHELVTYCGVVFRRDHIEVLNGPRGQLCELCLLRMTRGRLPNPTLVRWATWRPPRSPRGRDSGSPWALSMEAGPILVPRHDDRGQ